LTPNVALGPITGSTLGATVETGEPRLSGTCFVLSGHQLLNTVWYRFTPSISGTVHVSTENPGSNFDTVLALYDNPTSVANPGAPVACDNNGDSLNPPRSTNPAWSSVMDVQVLAGHTYYLQLGGVGGAPAGSYTLSLLLTPAAPQVTLSPTSLMFGSVFVGTSSGVQNVTMTNSGQVPLNWTDAQTVGDFTWFATGCANTLQPGQSCTFSVVFWPTAGGARSGQLRVLTNAPSSPNVVNLSGRALCPRRPRRPIRLR